MPIDLELRKKREADERRARELEEKLRVKEKEMIEATRRRNERVKKMAAEPQTSIKPSQYAEMLMDPRFMEAMARNGGHPEFEKFLREVLGFSGEMGEFDD